MKLGISLITVALAAVAATAAAQQPIVYPAKGQSAQKQASDTGECQVWAKQNTGVDPVAVAQNMANQPPPPQQKGEVAKGLVKGAAVGGVVGGIGGRGGEGAAAGAVVGAGAGRARQRDQQQQAAQQQQASQQQAQGQIATYNRAFSACMSGRGYTVN